MSNKTSSIMIYGICETPSILWALYNKNPNLNGVNRQYICLNDELSSLRIGDNGWLEMKPEQLLQFQSNRDMNLFTKEMLLSKVAPFNKPIKNALISYFSWVESECLKISSCKLSENIDPLFSNAEQLFFSAFLPLPHPKIVISDKNGGFIGVANFDLSFCINGKVYLLTFSEGQFIRKTERELRKKLFKTSDKFVFQNVSKPQNANSFDEEFTSHLLNTIPSLEQFMPTEGLSHGIYYPDGLTTST